MQGFTSHIQGRLHQCLGQGFGVLLLAVGVVFSGNQRDVEASGQRIVPGQTVYQDTG